MTKKRVKGFKGYSAFSGFIAAEDEQKLLKKRKLFSRGCCAFSEYSPGQLKKAHTWFEPGFPGTAQLKPMEKGLDWLEICRGYFFAPRKIPVTFDIDDEGIKRESCLKGQSIVSSPQVSPQASKRSFSMRKALGLTPNDMITYPSRYIEGGKIEPITVIEEFNLCRHLACVVQYMARAGRKTSAFNDLRKASWYLDREIQRSRAGLCVPSLNVKPDLSIQEIIEDWKLSAYLAAALSYILSARLESLTESSSRGKTMKTYVSLLTQALKHFQSAILGIEEGARP